MTVGFDPNRPLTPREAQWLEWYARDRVFHPYEVFCGDCSTRRVCCRASVPESVPARRSWWRRLFRKD